jgi:hypothetical protein
MVRTCAKGTPQLKECAPQKTSNIRKVRRDNVAVAMLSPLRQQPRNIHWPDGLEKGMVRASPSIALAELRAWLERAHGGCRLQHKAMPFSVPVLDIALPGDGLALGCLHEVIEAGPAAEYAATSAACTTRKGVVVYVIDCGINGNPGR